jgi:hypothetical protein
MRSEFNPVVPLGSLTAAERAELDTIDEVHECTMEEDMEECRAAEAERHLIDGAPVGAGGEGVGGNFYCDDVVYECGICLGDVVDGVCSVCCASCEYMYDE